MNFINFTDFLTLYEIKLFYWLNSFAFQSDWIDAEIMFRARYLGIVVIVAFLAYVGATFLKRYIHLRPYALRAATLAFSSAIVARWVIKPLIALAYIRARPYEVLPMVKKLFEDSSPAFPSGHALFFFALATGIFMYYPRAGIFFFLAAVTIALARVQAGVHWPSDIFAGAILGILTALATKKILDYIKK